MVGSSTADGEFYRAETFWAMPFVGGTILVNINSHVHAATVEPYADELALLLFLGRRRFLRHGHRRRSWITDSVKHAFIIAFHGQNASVGLSLQYLVIAVSRADRRRSR